MVERFLAKEEVAGSSPVPRSRPLRILLFLFSFFHILVSMSQSMKIKSPVFEDKGRISSQYTCDGEDINPPLQFENVPEEAQTLVLLVEDPDSVGKTWLHWAVVNIDPHTKFVNEDSVPGHGTELVTDFGSNSYGGPCPANGIHRYNFKLFALSTTLDLTEDVTLEEIYSAMEGSIVDKAEITALYSRE